MSIFSRLFSTPAPAPVLGVPADATQATTGKLLSAPTPADPLAELKQQRHECREHLYDVVRSVMLRSEVMASQYKFKVLSLDARGRQFLVMIDLLGDQVLSPERWLPVELLMAMTAAQRHDLQVKAVYWRLLLPQAGQAATSTAACSTPVVTESAPAEVAAAGAVTAGAWQGFDPIDNDELMAFQRAISAALPDENGLAQSDRVVASGLRKPAPQPDFEDTQSLETDDYAASPLSGTQFGGLG